MRIHPKIRVLLLAVAGQAWLAKRLERPLYLLQRVLEKGAALAEKLHRNLPRVRELAARQGELPVQVAAKYYRELGSIVSQLPFQPTISILVPIYKVRPDYLREALLSVERQVYPKWELCLVDDASGQESLTEVIRAVMERAPGKVKYAVNKKNLHISATSNAALALATGEYVGLLDHDDRLYPHALAEMVRYLNKAPEGQRPEILYSDECTTDAEGEVLTAIYRKPAWSPLMHLAMNYTTHLSVYRRELLERIGGFRVGFEGAQDHDLMLRAVAASRQGVVHVPFNLYQWRAHPASTANARDAKPYAAVAGERAVGDELRRRGWPGEVAFDPKTLHYRVKFALGGEPWVSIIIPSKDSADLLAKCLDSVRLKSTYKNFEVVISDNGSVQQQTEELYARYRAELGSRFTVLREERPFNFGAQVNAGARAARGDYLVLLNNDTEVLTPDWLEELLRLAQLPEIGAVGCKLLLPSGPIQHAGILLSAKAIAEHAGFMCKDGDNLYWNVLNTMHETMAVSAACLMVAKAKFFAAGGMDEQLLSRAYGDVEFCLALRDKGLVTAYTPYARMLHHEQKSRGRSIEYFERFLMLERRGQVLAFDPYLNPRLQRGPYFRPNPFYDALDLSGADFRHFLEREPDQWGQLP